MAQNIKPTNDLIEKTIEKIRAVLAKEKTVGKIMNLPIEFESVHVDGITIRYTPEAWLKQVMLVLDFKTEVAWHAVIDKDESGMYIISDILVYPQKVTQSTVDTDDESYGKWMLTEVSENDLNHLRAQMHSHADGSVIPSGRDANDQEKTLSQIDNGFYCFMIWNRRFDHYCVLYDLDENILYENDDITVGILGQSFDIDAYLKNAHEKVTSFISKVPNHTGSYAWKDDKKSRKKNESVCKSPGYYGSGYGSDFWDE